MGSSTRRLGISGRPSKDEDESSCCGPPQMPSLNEARSTRVKKRSETIDDSFVASKFAAHAGVVGLPAKRGSLESKLFTVGGKGEEAKHTSETEEGQSTYVSQ